MYNCMRSFYSVTFLLHVCTFFSVVFSCSDICFLFFCVFLYVQGNVAGRAYESVLTASLATNKATTKRVEMLTQELESLQRKYDRAIKEGSEQEEIIVMLQQQRQEGERKGEE